MTSRLQHVGLTSLQRKSMGWVEYKPAGLLSGIAKEDSDKGCTYIPFIYFSEC